MTTLRDHILGSIEREIANIKHLYTKIPHGSNDWRPRPDMRTTLELLQYISYIGIAQVESAVQPAPTSEEGLARYKAYREKSFSLNPEDFPNAMDETLERVKALLATVTDEDILTRIVLQPWGNEQLILDALIGGAIKHLTAYRHQLFLYARINGAPITTSDNWRGVSAQPVAKTAA